MKSLRLLAPLLVGALTLVGCGDGSVKSPTFTPVLIELQLTAEADAGTPPADFEAALGEEVPLIVTGSYTTPPGSDSDEVILPVNDASFTLSPEGRAEISNGVLRGLSQGVVTVTASKDGATSESITIAITPPELVEISIVPADATVPVGGQQRFDAMGRFTDSDELRPTNVDWALDPLTTSPNLSLEGDATDSTFVFVRASAMAVEGDVGTLGAISTVDASLEATASIEVTSATPIGIDPGSAVLCNPNPIAIGAESTCSVRVRLSNGQTADGAGFVTWSATPDETIVSVVDANAGTFNGEAAGEGTVRATFNGTAMAPGLGTVDGSLTVSASASAFCPNPLLAPSAAVVSTVNPLCLLCTLGSPELVIDDDADTAGSIDATLALLGVLGEQGGRITLNVNRVDPVGFSYPASVSEPVEVGFVISQPVGLLSAELLSSLQVSTVSAPGVFLQSGAVEPQPSDPIPVLPATVTALGIIGGQDRRLITFETTAPYNGIALTFDSGVLSLLSSIQVTQACAVADSAAVVPPP